MSAYIPEEMMVQIFSRLQSGSLLQFRCESKSCNSLISSTEFIWLHTKHTVLSKPPTGKIVRYFSKAQRKEKYYIQPTDALRGIETEDSQLTAVSPSQIPKTPLCFDNLGTYMSVFGFGFAIKTKDYKVVRMTYAHGDGGYLVPPKEFDGFIRDIGVVEYFWKQLVEIFQELSLPESLASEPPTNLNDAKCHFHVLHI
ncbi:hypothetical protein H5410_055612 [Solanum commersonii]|uniref:F-box domain-containing protein n=1 Tax=Solanum commersonii TaxID=4109 RepID=A0A9J5WKR9_SOLCO|nr:hypothetical protein H5410_055612 [Solanum commersonii]